jgi:hypothetical protein
MLIAAGRDALQANDKFRAFMASFGRTPHTPLLRPRLKPAVPVSQSDSAPKEARAQ